MSPFLLYCIFMWAVALVSLIVLLKEDSEVDNWGWLGFRVVVFPVGFPLYVIARLLLG